MCVCVCFVVWDGKLREISNEAPPDNLIKEHSLRKNNVSHTHTHTHIKTSRKTEKKWLFPLVLLGNQG